MEGSKQQAKKKTARAKIDIDSRLPLSTTHPYHPDPPIHATHHGDLDAEEGARGGGVVDGGGAVCRVSIGRHPTLQQPLNHLDVACPRRNVQRWLRGGWWWVVWLVLVAVVKRGEKREKEREKEINKRINRPTDSQTNPPPKPHRTPHSTRPTRHKREREREDMHLDDVGVAVHAGKMQRGELQGADGRMGQRRVVEQQTLHTPMNRQTQRESEREREREMVRDRHIKREKRRREILRERKREGQAGE